MIAFKNNATLSHSSPLKYDAIFVYTIDFKNEEIKELELYDYDEEHESCDSRNKYVLFKYAIIFCCLHIKAD